jgi:hypothetical protein
VAEITDAELHDMQMRRDAYCTERNFLRLIAEVERLRKRVALCPHCGCKLAAQVLENPPLYEG